MTFTENVIIRIRVSLGLVLCALLFLFAPRIGQIAILDFLASKFEMFKNQTDKQTNL